jgi:hypothetical protein
MPGLRLTPMQAQRLWGLDPQTCGGVLHHLVEARFLDVARGVYMRRSDGGVSPSRGER